MNKNKRYTYFTTLTLDNAPEVEVEASFSVAWGSPETGRFGSVENYDPGSESEVEDVQIETIDYVTWSGEIGRICLEKLEQEYHLSRMLETACEAETD